MRVCIVASFFSITNWVRKKKKKSGAIIQKWEFDTRWGPPIGFGFNESNKNNLTKSFYGIKM